jgi:hypothetical protein
MLRATACMPIAVVGASSIETIRLHSPAILELNQCCQLACMLHADRESNFRINSNQNSTRPRPSFERTPTRLCPGHSLHADCALFSRMHRGFGRCSSRQPPSIPMSQTGTRQVSPTCLRYAPSDRVCAALSSLGAIFVPRLYGVISRLSIVFGWPRRIGVGCIRCYIGSCRAALGLARRCSTTQQPSTPMSQTGTRRGFRQ